jgi:hypothetical protein
MVINTIIFLTANKEKLLRDYLKYNKYENNIK